MMKNKFVTLVMFWAFSTLSVNAQTPYDAFDPAQKNKEMLKLPDVSFRLENTDTLGFESSKMRD